MANPLRTVRSTESPMDFEFTSRPTTHMKPVWAEGDDDPRTPRKSMSYIQTAMMGHLLTACRDCNRHEPTSISFPQPDPTYAYLRAKSECSIHLQYTTTSFRACASMGSSSQFFPDKGISSTRTERHRYV